MAHQWPVDGPDRATNPRQRVETAFGWAPTDNYRHAPGQLASQPVIGLVTTLTPPGGPLFDLGEAAAYLHKSERWVRRAFSERTVPTIKVGRSVFVRRADLDALIESGYRPANGSAAPGLVSVSPRARSKRPQALSDRTRGAGRADD